MPVLSSENSTEKWIYDSLQIMQAAELFTEMLGFNQIRPECYCLLPIKNRKHFIFSVSMLSGGNKLPFVCQAFICFWVTEEPTSETLLRTDRLHNVLCKQSQLRTPDKIPIAKAMTQNWFCRNIMELEKGNVKVYWASLMNHY